jgi:hypothetical protein
LEEQTLGQQLIDLGWQCGSVLPESIYLAIVRYLCHPEESISPPPVPTDWMVLISQTCDVVAPTLLQEPYIEILWCRAIDKPRSQFRDLRSTRQLDFRPNRQTHPTTVLNVRASQDRYLIPRALLACNSPRPDRRLSDISVRRLQAWIAIRYTRPAWPDAFVERITAVSKNQLLKALETVEHDDIAEVRVALSPNDTELNDAGSYMVAVFFIVDEQIWQTEPSRRHAVYTAFSHFISTLKSCTGIAVDETLSGVVNGATFSWQQVQSTDLWNFANLTHRD